METMEVMNNEMDEVICVAESITPKAGNGLKIVGGAAVAFGVGYAIYKGVKWVAGKAKAKKAAEEAHDEAEDFADVED